MALRTLVVLTVMALVPACATQGEPPALGDAAVPGDGSLDDAAAPGMTTATLVLPGARELSGLLDEPMPTISQASISRATISQARIPEQDERPVGQLVRLLADHEEDPSGGPSPYEAFPAMSADGTRIAVIRYDLGPDTFFANILRVRDGRRLRSLPLGQLDGVQAQRAERVLRRAGFRTLGRLEETRVYDEQAMRSQRIFEGHDLRVHYDPNTGGLAVYEGFRLVEQRLVPAQVPEGPLAMPEDEEGRVLKLISDLAEVSVSADGRTLVLDFSLCDCTCDIEPFSMPIRL